MSRHRAGAFFGGALLAVAIALVPATPASAHAVLLNSDPTAQATVAAPPAVIRLQFSEAVEVPFGSIRVVDNDGHDVRAGRLSRRPGNHEVDVAVHPRPGTNYVSWQVVAGDGHVERGVFSFAVGAPSKGPARVGLLQPTASAAAGWTYGMFRFGWFAALFALIGVAITWRWLWPPVAASAGLSGPTELAARKSLANVLVIAWLVSVLSGIGVLIGQAATDSGRSLLWAARPASVAQVLRTTAGHYWFGGVLLAALCVLPIAVCKLVVRRDRSSIAGLDVLLVLLVGETVSTAVDGHARTLGHPSLGVPALTIHLLAVGVWVGGLGAVLLLVAATWRLLQQPSRSTILRLLIKRFSRVAIVAVAAVVITGLVSATLDLASPSDLVNLPYGRMLLVKIVLLQIALVFGARHLWFIPGPLADAELETSSTFQRSALAELGVLGLIVVAASSLMVMVPGRSSGLATSGALNLQHVAGGYTVAISLAPNQPGEDRIYLLFLDRRGVPARSITHATAALGYAEGPQQPVGMVWIADGRFIANVTLPTASTYRLDVSGGTGTASATFKLRIRGSAPGPATVAARP